MRPGDEPCLGCLGGAIPCKGGGNRLCWKRDPRSAHIALIVDTYGGTRVVVGTRQSLRAHTHPGEFRHTVPNLIVHEPIAWNDIPIVIRRAKLEFEKWLATRPNLTEYLHRLVVLYKLRQQRWNGDASLDLGKIVET